MGKYLVAVSLVKYTGCRSFLYGGLEVIRGLNFLYSTFETNDFGDQELDNGVHLGLNITF